MSSFKIFDPNARTLLIEGYYELDTVIDGLPVQASDSIELKNQALRVIHTAGNASDIEWDLAELMLLLVRAIDRK